MDCSCSLSGTRYCETCKKNPNKRAIRITSLRRSEFASNIVVNGVKYHVQTENLGPKNPSILTSVFKDGEIISSKKIDYTHLLCDARLNEELEELMHNQYLSAISMLKAEKPKEPKMVSIYLEDVKTLLRENNLQDALKVLGDALTEHPFNSFLLSYYGCLDAMVNKNYDNGIELCKTAIEILKQEVFCGREIFYPVFYLNLGRAHLAAGAKKNAAEAFKTGLEADPEDWNLLREVIKLGMRRKPAIPFLKRSNPMNKYIGILRRNSNTLYSAKH